jgi:hypothetical protein
MKESKGEQPHRNGPPAGRPQWLLAATVMFAHASAYRA